jgi:hypothetical protein
MHTCSNQDIVKYEHSKWLVLSSLFFLIPSIYAYVNNLYYFSILSLFTSLISANYWRNPIHSWRRNMDLVFSKLSFIIYLPNGIIYVSYTPYLITGYFGLVILLYSFYLSGKLYQLQNNNWYKYHMLFHFMVMYEQLIVLRSMKFNNSNTFTNYTTDYEYYDFNKQKNT